MGTKLGAIWQAESTRHAWTPRKAVFLSGLSDPSTCALTMAQQCLLDALPIEDECKVRWNFPFVPGPDQARAPGLVRASWQNLSQFLGARRAGYRRHARRHWAALCESTTELLVITLSCGLEILNQVLEPGANNVTVMALGPVAWRRPAVPHILVQGQRDWISRRFFTAVDVTIPRAGHMDYVSNSQVLTLLRDRPWISTSK